MYSTEIHWLGRGVVIERIFTVSNPIKVFILEEGNRNDYDNDWWVDSAFWLDMNT